MKLIRFIVHISMQQKEKHMKNDPIDTSYTTKSFCKLNESTNRVIN